MENLDAMVLLTSGSSPRSADSMMALREGGSIVHSVSGGFIEDDLINRSIQAKAGAWVCGAPSKVLV